MLFRVAETLAVGFDHCSAVAGGPTGAHCLLLGWVMSPPGEPFPALALQAGAVACRTVHLSTYPRRDIAPPAGQPARALGFVMLAAMPPSAGPGLGGCVLTLAAQGGEARIDLPAQGIGPGVLDAMAGCDWSAARALLEASGEVPEMRCLLEAGNASSLPPLGIFSGWLDRVPVLPQAAERFHTFSGLAGHASPAGEFTLHLGFGGQPVRRFAVTALALLPAAPGGPHRLHPAPFGDLLTDVTAQHASVYGRLADPAPARGACEDVLLQIDRDAERHWLRLRPRPLAVPAFLEAQERARLEAGCTDLGSNHAWLRSLAGSREQGLRTRLSGLGLLDRVRAGEGRPVLAVILGLDDPIGARMIHLAAPLLERRCAEVVLLGREAAAAARGLVERGRLPVRVGTAFLAASRHGAQAGAAVVLTDAAALAEALVEDRLDPLFADALPGERLGALRDLSACTGSGDPADALWRLVRLRAERRDGGGPVPRFRPGAPRAVADHLGRLWAMLAPEPPVPEPRA